MEITGLALIGYISFINLVARLTGNSIIAILIYVGLNAAAAFWLWLGWREDISVSPLLRSWRVAWVLAQVWVWSTFNVV